MDWNLAIEHNRAALKRVLAMLVSMAGMITSPSPLWGSEGRARRVARPGTVRGGGSWAPALDELPQPAPSARPPVKGEVGPHPTLPRHLHRAVLRLLRPAEAAARRLIIVAARDVTVPPARLRKSKPKPMSVFLCKGSGGTGIVLPRGFAPPAGFMTPVGSPPPLTVPGRATRLARPSDPHKEDGDIHVATSSPAHIPSVNGSESPSPLGGGVRGGGEQASAPRLSFQLLDPLPRHRLGRRVQRSVPRISLPGITQPFAIAQRTPPAPDDPIDATRLALRLRALERALDDLPGHARRFARWRNRGAAGAQKEMDLVATGAQTEENSNAAGVKNGRHRGKIRRWPLRMSRPPSWRGAHEVHAVLANTHGLALWALERRDTS